MTTHSNPFGKPNEPKKISNPFGNAESKENAYQEPLINHAQETGKPTPYQKNVSVPPKKDEIAKQNAQEKPSSKPFQGQNVQSNLSQSQESQQNEELIAKEYETLSTYNSSTYALRCTVNKVPANIDIHKEANISIGLTITPLSKYVDPPVIKYENDYEIPRCAATTCRAYINPFNKWVEGGDKWICNMCKTKNVTQNYYFEGLDKSGERKDKGKRPEISEGSYEFIANSSYLSKDKAPKRPTYIFVIDVSLAASHNGFLTSSIEAIKNALSDLKDYEEDTKVRYINYLDCYNYFRS